MAVGPKQLSNAFKEEVATFEKLIDAALLKKSFSPGGKITIEAPRGLTDQHLAVLLDKYVKAGWKGIHQEYGDQRDPGYWLTFES